MKKPAPSHYAMHPLMIDRWSPCSFEETPVDSATLRSLLEAARWPASCFNEQPWRFMVASRAEEAHFNALLDCLVAANQSWARHAGALALIMTNTVFEKNGKQNRHAWYDTGQAAAHFALQATSLGLAVHQMAGFDGDKARQHFSLPDHVEPVAAMAVGYPLAAQQLRAEFKDRDMSPRVRAPQEAFAFSGTFGEPFRGAEYERILWFWFGHLDSCGLADEYHARRWWKKDPAFDTEIRERFGEWMQPIAAGKHQDWMISPRGRLASVIALDQFSRNVYRGQPESFACDELCLTWARKGIEEGHAEALKTDEIVFLYMPLMHSESLDDQEMCVKLFSNLHRSLEGPARERIANNLEFACRHRDVIARFGRFPHRNAILGRESTSEEIDFLVKPGASF